MHRLLRGERVLFVAPTGHGKSLCYQGLAANPWSLGVVLVFTPLKALMAEQAERARLQGLRAREIHSDVDSDEQLRILDSAVAGELDMLFLAPERLPNQAWKDRVPEMAVKGIVVDEAHCISQWGHDFRPWYRRLIRIVAGLGLRTPVLAVTATAPGQVVRDVEEQIATRGRPTSTLRLPSVRGNVDHEVWIAPDPEHRLAIVAHVALSRPGAPGIVYCTTTRDAEQTARFLAHLGLSAVAYHARFEAEEKAARLASWQLGEVAIVCSTSALGMGVDRADVRWVLHAGMPPSLIQYVQEFGRAGRDGRPAVAIAVHDPTVEAVHVGMLQGSAPDPSSYADVLDAVDRGLATRTGIVEDLDWPEMAVQRLLEDLVEAEALVRTGTSPARYARGPGTPPTDLRAEARRVRLDLLREAFGWPDSPGCRRVTLAAAMGDAVVPARCGRCDRCRSVVQPSLDALLVAVRAFLDHDRPDLRGDRNVGLSPGVALSWYGMGDLGAKVAAAKRGGRPAPPELLAAAQAALAAPPFDGAPIAAIVCLPPTTAGDFVLGFARALGAALHAPVVPLVKTRATRAQKSFTAVHNKHRNVRGAFTAGAGTPVQGILLLVDDICDSGASLKEAARTLKKAGRVVRPLTMARTRHADDL